MRRIVAAELLDNDAGTPAEIAASLADLRNINRRFGGVATTQSMVVRVAGETGRRSFSLLDVAAGAGDVPRIAQQRLQRLGIELDVTLLDRAHSHLSHGQNGNGAVVGDALALPFRDASFDLLSCNLFVHHLSPDDAVRFVDEGLRVCRTAVLINDLIRHPLHLALTWAGMPMYRSRITRHDAPASVRQAHTIAEMQGLLLRTKAARAEVESRYLYRMGVVVWKW